MARISDLFAAGPTYSVEFMPPNSDDMLRRLEKTVQELSDVGPSFCSVTYGAGGGTNRRTLEAVAHIHRDAGLVAMPHLTCVGHTSAEIHRMLDEYGELGLENLLALAGDPPRDGQPAGGDFAYATELVEVARRHGDWSIGVAAFPEVHPRSPSREDDRRRLADKLAMADFGITQFFWEAEPYFVMVEELAALGCTTPVIPSVFPIINVGPAKRFTVTNGARWPDWLEARVAPVADDAEALRQVGVDIACEIGRELLDRGVPGLHIYTMNRSASALEIWERLGLPVRP